VTAAGFNPLSPGYGNTLQQFTKPARDFTGYGGHAAGSCPRIQKVSSRGDLIEEPGGEALRAGAKRVYNAMISRTALDRQVC